MMNHEYLSSHSLDSLFIEKKLNNAFIELIRQKGKIGNNYGRKIGGYNSCYHSLCLLGAVSSAVPLMYQEKEGRNSHIS